MPGPHLTDRDLEPVTLTLPRWQWGVVGYACRSLRRKSERQLELHPNFVPEPGKTNVHETYTAALRDVIPALRRALGEDR